MSKRPKPKAIIYCRFSPRRNAEECESIETQEEYCRAFCERKKLEVVEVFRDPDVSGSDEDRPQLWNAIDALKRGYVLVAYKADRLARGVYLDELIRRSVSKAGATIAVVEGSSNGDNPEDVLIRQVLAAFAEYERKVIAARTRAAMLRHQSTGRAMSKLAPYGWSEGSPELVDAGGGRVKTRRTFIVNPSEQLVIAEIAELHRRGESYRGIARILDEQGRKPRGEAWNHKIVQSILRRLASKV